MINSKDMNIRETDSHNDPEDMPSLTEIKLDK